MLKFQVFDNGRPASSCRIRNAYMLGADQNAVRADFTFREGALHCDKKEFGAAAFALQQSAGDCGDLTLQTCLLPEREEPYLLTIELVRHRLMLLYHKLEEWGMFDLGEDHPVLRRMQAARQLFIRALAIQVEEPAKADELAREALVHAIDGSEELALTHAERFLSRRKQTGSLPRHPLGCGVALDQTHERLRGGILANFDFVLMPMPWRELVPAEAEYAWQRTDNWAEWVSRNRMPAMAGPIISFHPSVLPDWVYIWEHDYDQVRDLLYEHIERVVTRYRNVVSAWNVVSGLHVNDHFTFNFEQLLDLTRMATMLVKKVQPSAKVVVELCQPFGEYYCRNQRSIPPLMYADLLIQSAIDFDAFALKLSMGQAVSGQYTRDLMQISHLIDQFAGFGKSVHVTLAAPSDPVTEIMIASPDPKNPVDPDCGIWRRPWSQQVQAHWAEALLNIALSKPFVDSVAWQDVVDHGQTEVPLSGLVSEELKPKTAFRRVAAFRRSLTNGQASNGESDDGDG